MDLLEYQAQELFRSQDILTPVGEVVSTAQFLSGDFYEPTSYPVVVKAQVHVGGRGKAGGVRVVSDVEQYQSALSDILGMKIKKHKVNRVYVVDASKILQEYYVSIMFDRSASDYLLMLSQVGGMDIETVALEQPENLVKQHFSPLTGLTVDIVDSTIDEAGFDGALKSSLSEVILKLWNVYQKFDAVLVEVNPLALIEVDGQKQIAALDAKVTLDDNAQFRQSEIFDKFEITGEQDPLESKAKAQGLAYVKLAGSVGIIGNGAGLVMSTLDLVSHFGKNHQSLDLEHPLQQSPVGGESDVSQTNIKPANFLDIGGGASAEHMRKSLELVMSDNDVNVVFINVFGGLTQCSLVANGILEALDILRNSEKKVCPIVVRFDGNEAQKGVAILEAAGDPDVSVYLNQVDGAKAAIEIAHARILKRKLEV
jgi:succinyl-CoA synthetase beta subunit